MTNTQPSCQSSKEERIPKEELTRTLCSVGLRPTRQRLELAALLFTTKCRHVSAEALHKESIEASLGISLATIYNTLNHFVDKGLVQEVIVDSGRAIFDTNTARHQHFYDKETGDLMDVPDMDVPDREGLVFKVPQAPEGYRVVDVDVKIAVKRIKEDR